MSDTPQEKLGKPATGNRRKLLLVSVAVAAVALLALALGLGLGLGLKHNTEPSSPSSTPTPTVGPGGNNTNGTWWSPTKRTTWQIQILYPLNDTSHNVEVYDIDLFLNNASAIQLLHSQGRKVICYFSAGSYENFRPDSSLFRASDYSKALEGWPGEWWLNTNSSNVRSIMLSRLDRAQRIGCDGVDPDNVDGYDNDTGLKLSQNDAVDYLTFLADAAHNRNMSIGLKNAGDIVTRIISHMSWEVNEQCVQYNECEKFQPFIAASKPVFHIEYPSSAPAVSAETKNGICGNSGAQGFSTLLKEMQLSDWVETCN